MTEKITVPEAIDRLRKRGADDVAAVLRGAGVKGNRRNCHSCPIAVFVKKVTGEDDVKVFGMEYLYGGAWVDLPRAARAFVKRFDNYQYSDLVL